MKKNLSKRTNKRKKKKKKFKAVIYRLSLSLYKPKMLEKMISFIENDMISKLYQFILE
jgi:response regulator RpfG family c-di-GMP phosphodiesterase